MTDNIFFVLLSRGSAIGLYISIARGLRDKQLKITLVSPPTTKVEKILLTGSGLTVAIIGFSISATLFTYSGLQILSSSADLQTSLLLMIISIFIAVVTMGIASYVNPNPKE
jgi:hypothetical protein